MQREKGFMPKTVVDAIVKNVKQFKIRGVRLIRWGEPTLHPELIEIIKQLKETGTLVHLNTNGSLLDKEMIKNLVDSGLDSIKISFQGTDEGTYNEMREGGDYVKLLNRIEDLYEYRGVKETPFIQISTTLTDESHDQINNFSNDVEDKCDFYNIGTTNLYHIDEEKMARNNQRQKIQGLKEKVNVQYEHKKECAEAFDNLAINWNGDVTLCESDYDNFMVVGNILDLDLRVLFTSPEADYYRNIILNREYSKIRCCKTCYSYIQLSS